MHYSSITDLATYQTKQELAIPLYENYCGSCKIEFGKWVLFQKHVSQHHDGLIPENSFKNSKLFVPESIIIKTVPKVHNGLNYCGECDKKYVRYDKMAQHIIVHHNRVTPENCYKNGLSLEPGTVLNCKLYQQNNNKCGVCMDASFTRATWLHDHIREKHQSVFPLGSVRCGQIVSEGTLLCEEVLPKLKAPVKKTKQIHLNPDHRNYKQINYQCLKCKFKFTDNQKLNVHIQEKHQDLKEITDITIQQEQDSILCFESENDNQKIEKLNFVADQKQVNTISQQDYQNNENTTEKKEIDKKSNNDDSNETQNECAKKQTIRCPYCLKRFQSHSELLLFSHIGMVHLSVAQLQSQIKQLSVQVAQLLNCNLSAMRKTQNDITAKPKKIYTLLPPPLNEVKQKSKRKRRNKDNSSSSVYSEELDQDSEQSADQDQ